MCGAVMWDVVLCCVTCSVIQRLLLEHVMFLVVCSGAAL